MRIAICDDLREERSELRRMLVSFAGERELLVSFDEFEKGEALCAACQAGTDFDLIFLDIYMGEMNGIETAVTLRHMNVDTPLIFLTSSPDFALQGYEVAALSYLLKPLKIQRLWAAMDRFLKDFRPRSVFLQGRIFINDDIVSAESRNKTVVFCFKDGTNAEIQEKLDTVAEILTGKNFLRCHQSFIINMDYVSRVDNGMFYTTTGSQVLIRKREFAQMRKAYYDYLISN